ncbi:MAG: hypothetical protein J6S83_11505 [Lachnospiraceae bacterium]|nr:hypothetical protein [Lachnospiraceae bacterium]
MKNARILPDPRVKVKEWDIDGKPASIYVEFGDNTTEIYARHIMQPHPSFVKAIGNIRTGYQYGYVGKHAKK